MRLRAGVFDSHKVNPSSQTGTLTAVPTYESVSLYWAGSGQNSSVVGNVQYRVQGTTTWKSGYPMVFDTRSHAAGDISPYTGIVRPANEYRGSIVGLLSATTYEIQVTAATVSATTTVTTWTESEDLPIGTTVTVTNTSSQLTISTSGTPTAYRLYTPGVGVDATINVANAADNCILVNASYIIIRRLTLIGASKDAILLGANANNVIIEQCDISNWGATTFPTDFNTGADTHAGVRVRGAAEHDPGSTGNNRYGVTKIVVQCNKIHDPRGTANNWDVGYPFGPQGICFQEAGGNHVLRNNEIYSSNDLHYFQDGIGGLFNFSKSGFPRADSDIYGNMISRCWDDGIESEGADCNVRIWSNFIDNTFTGVACGGNSIGPLYIFRNVTYVGRRRSIGTSNANLDIEDRGPFNKCGSQDENANNGVTFLFHNTVLQPTQSGFANTRGLDGGIVNSAGGPLRNAFSRNNIWTTAYTGQGGRPIAEDTGSGAGCTYDYDLCNTSNVIVNGTLGPNIITGTATFANGVPTAPLAYNGGPRATGYVLSTSSLGYNSGIVLPNFSDGYVGTFPDRGAYENGAPLLKFGTSNCNFPVGGTTTTTTTTSTTTTTTLGGNVAPTANAGSDKSMTLPTNSVSLVGSGNDTDGTISGFLWSWVSGPATFSINTPTASTTTVSNLVAGTYVFQLRVTDNGGKTGVDTVTVVVNAAAGSLPIQEGFGALATGHAFGGTFTTYTVTNTNASGAGSLNGGITSGNKRIIFSVSGTINSRHDVTGISNLTIDGTTAPYPGIKITTSGGNAGLSISDCDNVVVKGLTFFDCKGPNSSEADGMNVLDGSTNVLVSHCFAYGNYDGNIDFAVDCSFCTMQYCVIGNHVFGSDQNTGGTLVTGRKVTIHHNLFYPRSPNPDEGERFPFSHFNYGTQDTPKMDARSNLTWMYGRGNSHNGSGYGVCISYGANGNAVNNYVYTPSTSSTDWNRGVTASAYGEASGHMFARGNLSGNGTTNANANSNSPEFAIPAQYQVAEDPPCQAAIKTRQFAGPTQRDPSTGLRESLLQSHFNDLPATLPRC